VHLPPRLKNLPEPCIHTHWPCIHTHHLIVIISSSVLQEQVEGGRHKGEPAELERTVHLPPRLKKLPPDTLTRLQEERKVDSALLYDCYMTAI
jgi:hypothetical protein